MSATQLEIVQGSLFEEDYLVRSLGNITRDPEYAITELVANSWDAGSPRVEITIPSQEGDAIQVSDQGTGMSSDEFKARWMKLGYNRLRHQGVNVVFPPSVIGGQRRAYGRNGVGRHGMFCFADEYTVTTKNGITCSTFNIRLASEEYPFVISSEVVEPCTEYGTTISAVATRNLPSPDSIREVISARFIHDPQFVVCVNGTALGLTSLPGADEPVILTTSDGNIFEVIVLDSMKQARTKQTQGFAFWVQNRLVGEPTWSFGGYSPIDARTSFGRRFTILVKCDFMEPEVKADWSGFKKGVLRAKLYKKINDFALSKYQEYSREKIEETQRSALSNNIDQIRNLNGVAKEEVATFVATIVESEPTIKTETLSVAVQAVINLQQTKSGQRLLEKLSALPSDDVAALDDLLSAWSAQDALIVLDEIDRRIATIRAIELLSSKEDTDELHTLHPLVTGARWLFGAEYESSEYASNMSIKNAVNKVFKVQTVPESYQNWRKRPDLLMLAKSTLGAVGLEEIDQQSGLVQTKSILLLELKKGASTIGGDELYQAEKYIQQIRNSGCIQGNYYVHSFVIGHHVNNQETLEKALSINNVEYAKVRGVCFSTLTQTASRRLFTLKDRLEDRYSTASHGSHSKLLAELLAQQPLSI